MISKRKKKTIAATLFWGTIIINILSLLFVFLHGGAFAGFWIPVFILSSAAIIGMLCRETGNGVLRGFVLFFLIIAIVVVGLFFILVFISQLGP